MVNKGWRKEGYRHSLASRGIQSTYDFMIGAQSSMNQQKNEVATLILNNGFGFKELERDIDFHEQGGGWKVGTTTHFQTKLTKMHRTLLFLWDNRLITEPTKQRVQDKIIKLEVYLNHDYKKFKNEVRNEASSHPHSLENEVDESIKRAYHACGIKAPLCLQPGFVNMVIKDETDATKHYRQMAAKLKQTHPAYAEVLKEMAEDEARHARYLKGMKGKKPVDIRTVVKDDSKNIIEKLRERNMLTKRQGQTLKGMVDKQVNRLPPEKLKARGLLLDLVAGMLPTILSDVISGAGESKSKKGGK